MIDISKGRYWDKPWSLVSGCTPCSPGCDHCWSAAMANRFYNKLPDMPAKQPCLLRVKDGNRYEFSGNIITHLDRLSIPLKRKNPTVYAIWNDFYHEKVTLKFWRDAYEVMGVCKQHIFLILTKRPKEMNMYHYHNEYREVPGNIWHGLTVCNQQEADEKIPVFLKVPGKKYLSIEPMLSEIKLGGFDGKTYRPWFDHVAQPRMIDAVILGGETLGNRPGREMKIEWAESIADQCESAGIPLFIKQIHLNGKISKDISEWQDKLQRRELPWGPKC